MLLRTIRVDPSGAHFPENGDDRPVLPGIRSVPRAVHPGSAFSRRTWARMPTRVVNPTDTAEDPDSSWFKHGDAGSRMVAHRTRRHRPLGSGSGPPVGLGGRSCGAAALDRLCVRYKADRLHSRMRRLWGCRHKGARSQSQAVSANDDHPPRITTCTLIERQGGVTKSLGCGLDGYDDLFGLRSPWLRTPGWSRNVMN